MFIDLILRWKKKSAVDRKMKRQNNNSFDDTWRTGIESLSFFYLHILSSLLNASFHRHFFDRVSLSFVSGLQFYRSDNDEQTRPLNSTSIDVMNDNYKYMLPILPFFFLLQVFIFHRHIRWDASTIRTIKKRREERIYKVMMLLFLLLASFFAVWSADSWYVCYCYYVRT
jgi:hypothetical protein